MAVYTAAKVATTIVSDKNLRKIAIGILIGGIIILIAPIAIMLGVTESAQSADWNSPGFQQRIYDNMTPEQQEKLKKLEQYCTAIESEIIAQGIDIDPIKAEVIFLCLYDLLEDYDGIITDFIGCLHGTDDEIFNNISAKFGIEISAEERARILELCEVAIQSQTVPPHGLHDQIGNLLKDDSMPLTAEKFISPLHVELSISSSYGRRKDPFTSEVDYQSGTDFRVPEGTTVYPSKSGKVLLVGFEEDGYGHYVVINHGGGQATMYAHCSEILMTVGQEVTLETVIAKSGNSGRSTGPHLHFEIIIDGKPKNPMKYLDNNY